MSEEVYGEIIHEFLYDIVSEVNSEINASVGKAPFSEVYDNLWFPVNNEIYAEMYKKIREDVSASI